MKALLSMSVPVPPLDVQREFSKIIESLHITSMLKLRGLRAAENLTASLMSGLLGRDT